MTKPTELRTERLLLRPFSLSDIDDVLAYASDDEWAAFHPRPYGRGAVEYMVARAMLASRDKGAEFAVVLDGRVVGLVSLDADPEDKTAELGYEIARDVWGRGIAAEAATAVCDWGFREYGLARIDAWADPRNKRSVRVMEKLGMTYEGRHRSSDIGRGERLDEVVYAVLRDEWSELRGPLSSVGITARKYDTTHHGECRRLTTPRLVLRPFGPGDVDDVFQYARDPEWAQYLLDRVPQPYTRRNAEEFIAGQLMVPPDKGASWAIVLDGACIGGINLTVKSQHETGEIGYALARAHWGRGFAPEAAGAVLCWGFQKRRLSRISSLADVRNRRSWRVMEKLGMRREGVARSHRKDPRPGYPRIDVVSYGLLREEWELAAVGQARLCSGGGGHA